MRPETLVGLRVKCPSPLSDCDRNMKVPFGHNMKVPFGHNMKVPFGQNMKVPFGHNMKVPV